MVPSLSLLFDESSVSVKENHDRKKITVKNGLILIVFFNPLRANPQNGQTHSNNSSASNRLFECVWLFGGLALNGLTRGMNFKTERL